MKNEFTNATRYGEYLRKSTDDKEKQVLSLSSQRDVVDRLKKANTLHIVETIEEKMSAKRPGRPGFARLIKLIKERKIDGIVTWAPHRLSRNSVDSGEIINLFDTGHLKEIVTESHTYRNNPMDIFMLGFSGLQAKFENDNKAIDVRNGMMKCASLGIYPGCPPLGYLPDKNGIKGARKRAEDPSKFVVVQKIWNYLLTGQYTPKQVLILATDKWGLRNRNGIKLTKSGLYHMLNNPFYYGEYEWPRKSGNWHKGIHRPMITKQQFEKVQKMLGKTGRARPIKHYFPYGGCSLHCSTCGCAISGCDKVKYQKNGNVHKYQYYFCPKHKPGVPCHEMPVSGKMLDIQIENLLQEIQIPAYLHGFLMSLVRRENEKQFKDIYALNAANKKAYEAVLKKQNGLIDMRATGLLNDVQYQEKAAEAKQEEDRLLVMIKETDESIVSWVDTADKLFTFAELAVKHFRNGSAETKRGILVSLGWNLSIKDRKLDFSRENWIEPVKAIAKLVKEEKRTLEPVLSPYNKDKIELLLKNAMLCSLLHDVKTSFINMPDKTWFPIVDQWKDLPESL